MKQNGSLRHRARAERLYAWFLHLYPGAYRRRFGPQMHQTFRDHYRDAVELEGEPEVRSWLAVVGDEARSLLREHIATFREGEGLLKSVKLALFVGLPNALCYSLTWVFNDPGGRVKGAFLFPIDLVLFFLLASFLRTVPPSDLGRSWVRIGLISGGLMVI